MRNAFVKTLTELAQSDPRIMLLTADLGFGVFETLAQTCPAQFINVGVAEASMAGIAAGLALSGKIPFIYSIGPFATARAYEQIRNDIAYQQANVKIVGIGAGYSYGPNGPTHHAIEDIAIMRALPNMVVLCPGDPVETRFAVRAAAAHSGPVYLRLGRSGEPTLHPGTPDFAIGKGYLLREGQDVTLLSTSNMLDVALETADRLAQEAITARVASFLTVKPLDTRLLERCFRQSRAVFTLEEHSIYGGFGSAVAEFAAGLAGRAATLHIIGIPDRFADQTGNQQYFRQRDGLTAEQVAARVYEILNTRGAHAD